MVAGLDEELGPSFLTRPLRSLHSKRDMPGEAFYHPGMKPRYNNSRRAARGLWTGLLVAGLLTACDSMTLREAPDGASLTTIELRPDWAEVEPITFEQFVDEQLSLGSRVTFEPAVLAALTTALDQPAPVNVRAAVLLSRTSDPVSAEILLERLEKRLLGPERSSDAGDVVAAAGLASMQLRSGQVQRLSDLASGQNPHPDLEVRVEIARTALQYGRDENIPFLISVLRIGTRAGRHSGEFWPAPLRSAWARERAAEILSWRSGLEQQFSADASIADREREADRYEQALLGARQ